MVSNRSEGVRGPREKGGRESVGGGEQMCHGNIHDHFTANKELSQSRWRVLRIRGEERCGDGERSR